jgi:hypothetical protein
MHDITFEELERLTEARLEMFASEGWKDLLETMKLSHDKESDIRSIPDATELYRRQGRLEILRMVLNWETLCRNFYQRALEEKNAPDL